ncbi:Leucine Rich repeat-containing domain protein [Trichostrongylus colubriformis]|uniref:Leucine Rich repeat-containing domain protein n=1 Tax=Trichostrongylus colubriformis TaxID=6319 RepID=A0AAN8FRB1_TRICO
MRLECDVMLMKAACCGASKTGPLPSKCSKGIVRLGKNHTKSGVRYLLHVATRRDTKAPPIEISTNNMREMHLQRVASGRASFAFNNPAISVFIMKSNPAHLQRFVRNLQDILKGTDVSLKSLDKVKMSDFKIQPKKLCVEKKEDLRGIVYPSSLETLQLISLGIDSIDSRWFSLPTLYQLDLSRNRLGQSSNFVKIKLISRLRNLRVLSLEDNQIETLPPLFFESLPHSLQVLSLAVNRLKSLPRSIVNVRHLQTLVLSFNELAGLPRDMSDMRLRNLFVDNNRITFLPHDLKSQRFDRLDCDNNPLVIPLPPPERSSMASLCALSFASVRRFSLPETMLPWDLKMIADKLSVKCSKCREWTASPLISSCYVYERIDFAMETDRMHIVTMHCLACQKCVVRVGHDRNLL